MTTRVSVFTPFHRADTTKIQELYATLRTQTHTDWEWVIVLNGDGLKPGVGWMQTAYANGCQGAQGGPYPPLDDPRVKFVPCDQTGNVGFLKRFACQHATGDILVEADYDDLLTPDCLAEVVAAFEADPALTLAYSDFAAVNPDWNSYPYNPTMGWTTYPFDFGPKKLTATVSPSPHPSNVSTILFAPNHIRAWRATHYWEMGGHNPNLKVGDDHELCCRSFLYGKLQHIPKCLYVYRVHDDNSWRKMQEDVNKQSAANQARFLPLMFEKWSGANGLKKVDLCGGIDKPGGYLSLDVEGGDITADLNGDWPLLDSSVGILRAVDAVEHLHDSIHTMNEAYRVLAHGGLLFIDVPSTDGRGAWQDPTHKSGWNSNSAFYYCRKSHAKYLHAYKGRFQVVSVANVVPNEFCKQHQIVYTQLRLMAVKQDSPRFHGALEI